MSVDDSYNCRIENKQKGNDLSVLFVETIRDNMGEGDFNILIYC